MEVPIRCVCTVRLKHNLIYLTTFPFKITFEHGRGYDYKITVAAQQFLRKPLYYTLAVVLQ